MEKYVCIHGHFYQPPRENPWLEEVELQDSAYPYHDWNDRITAECYGPNAVARMLDHEWKIVNIVNNYTSISLNFGPTLLSWLKDKKPDVYQSILEADKQSQEKFSGHGTALAQAYNHVIMPLANARDKFTQAVWGIKDFEFRFGRKPEGMWLPETAVDLDTLEILAELGIRFTILSPYKAKQVRKLDSEQWQDATGARIDPTTPYIQNLPSGRSIILFFYDGHTSRAVAFEKLLESGERFANRLLEGFSSDRPWPQIVHIATDGESYGHHHVHGDMGLAFALHHIEKIPDVRVTIYGEFLDKHPPTHEVQIQEYTAWSCSHGVERWKSNCGCNSGRGQWNQEWRTPLREALDWLRDEVANPFEETTKEYLRDPWAARNEYVRVILDRSEENVNAFLDEFAARELTHEDKVTVLQLMELQRNAMLMYTSCGWFFDDISGIETVQVIAYAGRVIQLAQHLFDCDFEPAFLDRLEKAKSNLPEHQDGRHIYNKWIKPSIVDWEKIAAHYGVSSLFETYEETTKIYCYTAERTDYHSFVAGKAKMVVGRTKVSSEITWATKELSFGVLHFGDHNVNGGVRQFEDEKEYQTLLQELIEAFEKADFPQIIRLLDKGFKKSTYSLKSLFRDEQRKILKLLLQSRISEAESVYRRMYEDNLPTMRFLSDIESPLPKAFNTALEFVVSNDLNWAFKDDEPDLDHIKHLLEEAERWNVTLDIPGLAYRLKNSLGRMAERFQAYPTEMGPMLALEQSVDLASSLPFEVDLWQPQNIYCRLLENIYPELVAKAQAEDEAARSWIEHFISLGEKLGIQVADLKKKIANLKKAPTFANVLEEI